jgi:hypothetical protein
VGWLTPLAERAYAKGWITGWVEGMAKHDMEGAAESLAFFLEKRFGPLPDAIRQRIFAADAVSVVAWVGPRQNGLHPPMENVPSLKGMISVMFTTPA